MARRTPSEEVDPFPLDVMEALKPGKGSFGLVQMGGRRLRLPSCSEWLNSHPMPAFTHHIFVCCNCRAPGHRRGCCDPDASEALRNRFKAVLKQHDLGPLVRANKAGCLDQCERGPTVVIYPQQVWYGGVKLEDVPRIVEETILGGRVLPDLLIPAAQLNCKGGVTPGADIAQGDRSAGPTA